MMMSFAAMGGIGVLWVVAGYSLAFAPGSPWLGGLSWALFRGVGLEPNATYAATIPQQAHAAYQGMFAIITPALISGAIVERMRFRAYLAFMLLWSLIIYAPLAHWVWGAGGWLQSLGALDFAGGTVVHVSAGVSALVAAWMLGPRRDYRRMPLSPHSVPLVIIGAGLLWFGWFGFNAGSALAANGIAALAFVNTNAAAAAAVLTWALLDLWRSGKVTAVGVATGAVVGLVGITPAAGYVSATAALAIGAVCAVLSYFAIQRRSRSRLDDSLDVFSCHGLAGIAGALLTGVFAANVGVLAGHPKQLLVQIYAVLAAVVLGGVGTAAILALVRAVLGARPRVADELIGLDLSEHGEEAYFGGEAGLSGIALAQSVIVSTAADDNPERRAKGRAP
jgi:Amt family ammonium transporter